MRPRFTRLVPALAGPILLALALSGPAQAKFGERPLPEYNPNPPMLEHERIIVAFAEKMVDSLLSDPSKAPPKPKSLFGTLRSVHHLGAVAEVRFPHVVERTFTPLGDTPETLDALETELTALAQSGALDSGPHRGTSLGRMPVLSLPVGRHLVRMYARFDGEGGAWRRLEVVIDEGTDGTLALRHLFATPMRSDLDPPEVVLAPADPATTTCPPGTGYEKRPTTACLAADRSRLWAPRIYFKTDSARIHKITRLTIEGIAALLHAHPEIRRVEIQGHRDDIGRHQYGRTLSKDRAESVAHHLVELGIAAERLHSVGFGSNQPIASNDTREGRAMNRRIDIIVITDPHP